MVEDTAETKKPRLDLTVITQEIGKFTRKVNSLSKIADYVSTEAMPKIFGDKVDDVYRQTKKGIDYFIRHLI